MTKSPAIKTTDPEKVRLAKRAFYVNLFDMTWRMLLAMAVPVLLGAFLDKKFDTGDLFTAFGFLLSLVAAGFVIKDIVTKVSDEVK
jgi:hypothetical protein